MVAGCRAGRAEYERAIRSRGAEPDGRAMRTNVPGGVHVVGVDAGRPSHGRAWATVSIRSSSSARRGGPSSRRTWPRCARTGRSSSAISCASWTAYVLGGRRCPVTRASRRRGGREPYQRVAAYAVVTSERGVLLTQFNSQTAIAGRLGPARRRSRRGRGPGRRRAPRGVGGDGAADRARCSRDGPVAALGGARPDRVRRGLPCGAHRLRRDVSGAGRPSSTTSAARPPTPAGYPRRGGGRYPLSASWRRLAALSEAVSDAP